MSLIATAGPAVAAAFLASAVEVVEAFTIVLAVATLRGWRPALAGAAAAFAVLMAMVLGFGPLLGRVPLAPLRLAIGVLLLLFGLSWLRKAILRSARVVPLHNETAIYAREAAAIRAAPGRDWIAGMTAFKAVLLEGLEVVFIVVAVGAGHGLLAAAGLGALLACVLVLGTGLMLRRPLARVPENALKFGVGVLLSAFGVFWTGEGLGIAWPGADLAILAFALIFFLAAHTLIRWLGASSVGAAP